MQSHCMNATSSAGAGIGPWVTSCKFQKFTNQWQLMQSDVALHCYCCTRGVFTRMVNTCATAPYVACTARRGVCLQVFNPASARWEWCVRKSGLHF